MSFFKNNLEKINNKHSNLFLNPYENKNNTETVKETVKGKKDYIFHFEPLHEIKIKEPLSQNELDVINEVDNSIFQHTIVIDVQNKDFKKDTYVNKNKYLDEKIKIQIEELNKIKYANTIKKFY